MKAKIRAEISCGECGSLMQFHKESKYVRCNQIKCSQRHIDYLAPTIELVKPETEKPKRVRKSKATEE